MRSRWTLLFTVTTIVACGGTEVSTATSTTTGPSTTTGSTTTAGSTTTTAPATTTTTTAPAPTATEVDLPDVPLEFLRGVYEADYDLAVMDAAVELAVPRSPAWYFATLHRDLAAATLDWATWAGPMCGPDEDDAQISCARVDRVDAGTIEVCDYDWAMMGVAECGSYTDFALDDGRLATFEVRGLAIDPRLGGEGGPVTVGPVTARVTSSYVLSPENLLDVAFVAMRTDVVPAQSLWFGAEVEYVDPDGRTIPGVVRAADVMPPEQSMVLGVAVFERAGPGGTLHVSVDTFEPLEDCPGDGSCEEQIRVADLVLDVPAVLAVGDRP